VHADHVIPPITLVAAHPVYNSATSALPSWWLCSFAGMTDVGSDADSGARRRRRCRWFVPVVRCRFGDSVDGSVQLCRLLTVVVIRGHNVDVVESRTLAARRLVWTLPGVFSQLRQVQCPLLCVGRDANCHFRRQHVVAVAFGWTRAGGSWK